MSETKYQIKGFMKLATEDNFEQGEIGKTQMSDVDLDFEGKTAEEVIEKAADFLGVTKDDIDRNAGDEDGRVDFQKMETGKGDTPSKSQISAWKRGKLKLWSVTFVGTVEQVTTVKI